MREDYNLIDLSEICTHSKGKKPRMLSSEFSPSTPYPYINIKAFEKGIFDRYTDGVKCNLCEEGDLLMVWDGARSGYTGKAKGGAVGSTLMKIEPKQNFNKEYLFYFLLSLYTKLNTNPRGVGIPHVEPRLLWNSKIPLLSLSEQRTTVAKIEQLFSELDNGIANLETAKEQLKVYRQAVLKRAFEGRFTNKGISEKEIPKDWTWSKVGNLGEVSGGLTKNSEREKLEMQLPYLRVANVYANKLDLSVIKTIGIKEQELERVLLKKYDLLVVEGNGSPDQIGRVALWNGSIEPCVHQNHLIKLRFDERTLPLYVLYWLLSSKGRELIKLVSSSTSGLYTLSLSKVKNLSIPICGIGEQHQIVQQIESRLSVCDKVEETISENLQKAEALRQSILKKAFAGELLSKAEIAACKNEKDWEPAGVLLERIKKEKNNKKIE